MPGVPRRDTLCETLTSRYPNEDFMRTATSRTRRATASLLALALAVGGAVLATPFSAVAADVGFSVDDFAGNSMGTRALVPQAGNCDVTGSTNLTIASGTMRVDVGAHDALGCNHASAKIRWTAPTSVDLEQGGADRVDLRYRDVVPNQPSAVTFGVEAVDINGKVAGAYGLTRNGGPAGDWLTIRYVPAYVGDVAVFTFPSGFDRHQVKSITLLISTPSNNQDISVTFEGIGTNVGEPSYEAPSIGGPGTYAFTPSTTTTHTITVTGNPAPDVSVTGKPAWMTVTTSATSGGTSLVLSGNPATAYVDTSIDVHADVANSLTADRTLRIVVPSPVTVGYATNTTLVGQAGPLTLGTASSTPAAGILGPTTGLPPGTTIAMSGGSVVLTGTPTTAGDYTIATTVGTEWSSAAFSRALRVGQVPVVTAPTGLTFVRGEAITAFSVSATGYPAPTFSATGLPAGLSMTAAGAVSGTPTANVSADVAVTATNEFGSSTEHFTILVGDLPGVTAPSTSHVVAGTAQALSLVTAGAPSSVTATGLPAGLGVILDGTTWFVTGTPARPADATAASGVATFTATNAIGTSQATWSWVVDASPLVSGPTNASTTVGTALTGAEIVADGYPTPTFAVTDLDGDAPSLPTGLSIDTSTPGTVRIVGTPSTAGTVELRVVASNGIGTDAVHLLTVSALTAPSFTDAAPSITVQAGSSATLQLEWSGHELPTLTAPAALPGWLGFDATTGVFTATPPVGVSGEFGPYLVTATNTTGSVTASVSVVVTAPAALTPVGDRDAQQGVAITGDTIGSYTGYPAPAISATGLPAGLTIAGTGGQLVLSGTPTAAGGSYSVTVQADNGVGTAASETFEITVTVPATLAAIAPVSVPVDVALNIPVTATGYPAPALLATGLPAGLTLGADNHITGVPTTPGTFTITISAHNGIALDPAPIDVELTVRSAPVIQVSPGSGNPGGSVHVQASGFLPGESVDVELHSTPRLLATFTADLGGAIDGSVTIPTDTDPGSHSIVVIAASGATASTAFTVLAATGSGLARTGAAPVGDLVLAGLLLAIGLVFAMAGRRRRATLTR
jgi:hypothetical protein